MIKQMDLSQNVKNNVFENHVRKHGSDEAKRLLAKAKELVPVLRKRVHQIDELRRIPQETIDELTENGFFDMLDPKKYGGAQLNFREFVAIGSEIAKGCGSTAWVLCIISITKWIIATSATEQLHKEIFGTDMSIKVCGSFEPKKFQGKRVEGGYLIEEAIYGWISGSLHSDYFSAPIPVLNDKGEVIDSIIGIIPMEELEIMDDWYMVSMRGTGSNTIVVKNVFVPDYRLTPPRSQTMAVEALGGGLSDQALYRAPSLSVITLLMMISGLGLARTAFESVLERLPNRRIQYTKYTKQAESPITQMLLGEAAMKIDTAHLHIFRAAEDLDLWAESGDLMDYEARARVNVDVSYGTRMSKEAVDTLVTISGASSLAESSIMQRMMRDIHSPYLHAFSIWTNALEMYGAVLAGQEPNTTLI